MFTTARSFKRTKLQLFSFFLFAFALVLQPLNLDRSATVRAVSTNVCVAAVTTCINTSTQEIAPSAEINNVIPQIDSLYIAPYASSPGPVVTQDESYSSSSVVLLETDKDSNAKIHDKTASTVHVSNSSQGGVTARSYTKQTFILNGSATGIRPVNSSADGRAELNIYQGTGVTILNSIAIHSNHDLNMSLTNKTTPDATTPHTNSDGGNKTNPDGVSSPSSNTSNAAPGESFSRTNATVNASTTTGAADLADKIASVVNDSDLLSTTVKNVKEVLASASPWNWLLLGGVLAVWAWAQILRFRNSYLSRP